MTPIAKVEIVDQDSGTVLSTYSEKPTRTENYLSGWTRYIFDIHKHIMVDDEVDTGMGLNLYKLDVWLRR